MIGKKEKNLDPIYNTPLLFQFQNIYVVNAKEVSTNMKVRE